jgi:predicted DNA-binding transcriptional regulator AlpA
MVKLIRDAELSYMLGGVSAMTLWRMRQRQQLPQPKKLNGQNVTPEDEVEAALKNILEGAA